MFEGTWTALVTPFDESGKIQPDQYARLIESQLAAGITGIVPVGSTGEAATLDHGEHIEVITAAVKACKGKAKVMAGSGSNSTAEAVRLSRAAQDAGADALLLIVPYYNKPTQEGMIAHFTAVADAVKIPIVLYNIPGRTAVSMDVATVAKLAEHPNIVGMKEAGGDALRVTHYRLAIKKPFVVLSGDDPLTLPMMSLGADGVISVLSQVMPKQTVELVESARRGDYARARQLHNEMFALTEALFCETNPGPVKHAMYRLGLIGSDYVRPPLVRPRPASQERIVAALKAAGLKVTR